MTGFALLFIIFLFLGTLLTVVQWIADQIESRIEARNERRLHAKLLPGWLEYRRLHPTAYCPAWTYPDGKAPDRSPLVHN